MNKKPKKILDAMLPFLVSAGLTSAIILALQHDAKAQHNREEALKPKTETVSPTETTTHRDTVLVLDYKPYSKYRFSTTHATNKSGKDYKIENPTNLPVERGDEIIIDITTKNTSDGRTYTNYTLIKNLTTETMKQKYINKR